MIRHRDIGIEPRAKVPSDRHRVNVAKQQREMTMYFGEREPAMANLWYLL